MCDIGSVFPAYAGMIPSAVSSSGPDDSVPRIRGDDPPGQCFGSLRAIISTEPKKVWVHSPNNVSALFYFL